MTIDFTILKRIHLFEFEDFTWFPDVIRQGMTDYLRFIFRFFKYYDPVVPLIVDVLKTTECHQVVDLCSGGGGPIEMVSKDVNALHETRFILTDKYPNIPAYTYLKQSSNGIIDYMSKQVDAMDVPSDLKGLRTIFSAIHHFRPETVRAIMYDCMKAKTPLAIFDSGDKNIFTILTIIVAHPAIFLLATPFFRPFKWSGIVFTYLIPLIPICTIWDGVVSIIRLYTPKILLAIAEEVDVDAEFQWSAGKKRNVLGMRVAYLIGRPK